MSHRCVVEDTPPSGVSLTWSVTFVSGAGGPSAVVAGRWGRGDRGSPLLARGRIHSWNTEAQIYKSTYKTLSLVEHICQSSFFFSKCVLACFFLFLYKYLLQLKALMHIGAGRNVLLCHFMSINIQEDDDKVNLKSESGLRNNRRFVFVVRLQVWHFTIFHIYNYKPSLTCCLECSRSSVANSASF